MWTNKIPIHRGYFPSLEFHGKSGFYCTSYFVSLCPSNYSNLCPGNYRVMVELTTVTLEGSMQLAVTSALPTVVFSETTYVGRSGEQLIVNIEVGGQCLFGI